MSTSWPPAPPAFRSPNSPSCPRSVRAVYISFVLEGPSDLCTLRLLQKISVMIESYLKQGPVRDDSDTAWVDGLLCDPSEIRAARRRARDEAEIDVNLGYVARAMESGGGP